MKGISGMTEETPAAFSFCTTSGASVLVVAVSVGSEGSVSTTGVTPARLQVGHQDS